MAKKKSSYKFRRKPFCTCFNPRHPVIKEKKLGRDKAYGLAWSAEGFIEIDPRQDAKEYLDTLIHEMLHCYFPELEENDIDELGNKMTHQIWKKGYRRIQQ